jgi:hypothetical protein
LTPRRSPNVLAQLTLRQGQRSETPEREIQLPSFKLPAPRLLHSTRACRQRRTGEVASLRGECRAAGHRHPCSCPGSPLSLCTPRPVRSKCTRISSCIWQAILREDGTPAAGALPGLLPAGLSSLLHQELGRWQASLVRQAPPRSPLGMHQANAMPARRLRGTAARGVRLAVAARLQPMLLLLLLRASLTHAGGIPAGRSEQVKL